MSAQGDRGGLLVDVLKRAQARGATAADGFLIEEQHFTASVRLGQVDTVKHSRDQRLSLRVFAGRLGQKVASELVTVVDDGTMPNRRGSLNVDDEGTPTGRTVLIENGVLTGYMQDRLNSRLMKMAATGNGRRESYAHPPMPRMTNTFMLAGQDEPGDILRSVERGLYAVAFGGGQVDITSGKFVFSASEAYLIENGKVTAPVKGATLIGNGPDALTRVSRVGHDLKLDEGVGTCGKEGQSVPVGVGLPTIRIDGMTVGGTQV